MTVIRRYHVSVETLASINQIFSKGNKWVFMSTEDYLFRKMARFYWSFSLWQADDIHPRSTGMSHCY